MTKDELKNVLDKHRLWLDSEGREGNRAYLSGADLSGADMSGADMRRADLSCADLRRADLRRAYLSGADLRDAYLSGADLRDADLRRADLDYSSWPLWCGGLDVHIDDRQAVQLLYHLVRNVLYSKNTSDKVKEILGTEDIISLANTFHRVEECGAIQPIKKEDEQ